MRSRAAVDVTAADHSASARATCTVHPLAAKQPIIIIFDQARRDVVKIMIGSLEGHTQIMISVHIPTLLLGVVCTLYTCQNLDFPHDALRQQTVTRLLYRCFFPHNFNRFFVIVNCLPFF